MHVWYFRASVRPPLTLQVWCPEPGGVHWDGGCYAGGYGCHRLGLHCALHSQAGEAQCQEDSRQRLLQDISFRHSTDSTHVSSTENVLAEHDFFTKLIRCCTSFPWLYSFCSRPTGGGRLHCWHCNLHLQHTGETMWWIYVVDTWSPGLTGNYCVFQEYHWVAVHQA
jgi:hypothetical protein